ncbi:DUF4136 domain-containing protein [Colwelliaceae bacterium BS250]
MRKAFITTFCKIFALALLLQGCQSTNTTVDYDTDTNFSAFKKYQIVETKEQTADLDQLTNDRIKTAINEQLNNKAMTVNADNSDVQVSYFTNLEQRENKSSFSIGLGGSSRSGSSSTGVGLGTTIPLDSDFNVYTKITIDIYHKDKLVWRGTDGFEAENDITPQEKITEINSLVTTILAAYPPKK